MNLSIEEYLNKQGIYPAKRYNTYGMYYSFFHKEKTPSLKVDYKKDVYFDFSTNQGGNLTTLKKLLGDNITNFNNISPPKIKTVNTKLKNQIFRVQNLKNRSLIDYLNERKITKEIYDKYCYEVDYGYYENYPRKAIAFMNNKGGFELRSTQFKGCIYHKSITTIFNQSDDTYIFEGFIDFLSHKILFPLKNDNYIILNSTNQATKAIDFINQSKNTYCYLDNDEAANICMKYLQENSISKITDMRFTYKDYNDLNDYLMNKN
ncbi:toprim domain-containing protein [Wenyingzhuangia aestuarii]|uniref:toprim domain-containing protein n=1 Tax=Wenyingzhuangia aestuarii TaxID=1647582 RepID=UPI00143AA7DB|nr:toprim domain-containing protein [Wenyingzhuangia aestuarii]NJB83126.1 hypothetical protein [Wenyingzhuangia aestuarii]